jgi:hypothetical protein
MGQETATTSIVTEVPGARQPRQPAVSATYPGGDSARPRGSGRRRLLADRTRGAARTVLPDERAVRHAGPGTFGSTTDGTVSLC